MPTNFVSDVLLAGLGLIWLCLVAIILITIILAIAQGPKYLAKWVRRRKV